MARTSAPGGRILVDASSAVDTAGYGMVSILVGPAGSSVTVRVGETEDVDTEPVTTLIDPDTGDAIDQGTWTVPEREGAAGAVLAYVGECRYIRVTSTGTAYVLLEEARKTTPIAETATSADGSRSLTEVIAEAASGSTVRLTADFAEAVSVPEGRSLTLDLNGHSIRGRGTSPAITNAGTLTLRGGTVASGSGQAILNTGTLTVRSGTVDATAGTFAVESSGTLTLTGGTYLSGEEDCLYVRGGTVRVSGGSYSSVQCTVLRATAGTVGITGGTMLSESCSSCYTGYGYAIVNAGADMEVSGVDVTGTQGALAACAGSTVVRSGSFVTVTCPNGHSSAYHALYVAGEYGESACEVLGGTFHAQNRVCVVVGSRASLAIHGGGFSTGGGSSVAVVSASDACVYGGTYDRQLDDGVIADGYEQAETDGGWTVVPA